MTLGFFAENLREENAKRKLEIKLMHDSMADLQRIEAKDEGWSTPTYSYLGAIKEN